jgi:ion channel POLLUX/CASTOR
MLLGLISDAIGEYMDGLRQGRSDVIESGHTLILGRSDKLMEVIRQLSLANESEGGGVVVVLNETGKEEVEAEVCIFMYVCVITPPPPTFTFLFV